MKKFFTNQPAGDYAITEQGDLGLGLTPINESEEDKSEEDESEE